MAWEKITSEKQRLDIMNLSDQHPIVLFKHSLRCPISNLAFSKFEGAFRHQDFYVIDVIGQREISQHVATDLGITHQSPQLLIVSNQQCVANWSHLEISAYQAQEVLKRINSN